MTFMSIGTKNTTLLAKFFLFGLLLLLTPTLGSAQSGTGNINTIRELAIMVKTGFENIERQRQADKEAMENQRKADRELMEQHFEYLEKLIQANKEALEKLIQANKEALDKRMAFLENLMLVLITTALTQLVYIIWNDRKSRPIATKQVHHSVSKTVPLEEFEKLLKRVQQLEKQSV